MGIEIKGNVGHATNFEKDGVQINFFSSPEHMEQLRDDLAKLKTLADGDEKEEVQNALDGVNENNENKVLAALKKLVPFVGRVASNVAGNVIVAYMKANGLLPY